MLPVFSQLAGRRCLNLEPDKLVSQVRDAESAFDAIANCPKNGTPYFQFWNTPQLARLRLNSRHFCGIQELTTAVSFVALRMRSLFA
jgi:hypothetical protein